MTLEEARLRMRKEIATTGRALNNRGATAMYVKLAEGCLTDAAQSLEAAARLAGIEEGKKQQAERTENEPRGCDMDQHAIRWLREERDRLKREAGK